MPRPDPFSGEAPDPFFNIPFPQLPPLPQRWQTWEGGCLSSGPLPPPSGDVVESVIALARVQVQQRIPWAERVYALRFTCKGDLSRGKLVQVHRGGAWRPVLFRSRAWAALWLARHLRREWPEFIEVERLTQDQFEALDEPFFAGLGD